MRIARPYWSPHPKQPENGVPHTKSSLKTFQAAFFVS